MLSRLPYFLLSQVVLGIISLSGVLGQVYQADHLPCRANGGVRGICQDIKTCSSALGYLRANVSLPPCQGPSQSRATFVCCPSENRISAVECEKYQKSLRSRPSQFPLLPIPFLPTESEDQDVVCDLDLNALISGGRDAKIDEIPFMVALGYNTSRVPWRCGGTLISEDYVLTAAHCVNNNVVGPPNKLLFGDITLRQPTSNSTRIITGVSRIIVHPGYVVPQTYHDIALIKIDRKLNFSKSLRPACLPQAEEDLLKNIDTKTFTAAGFGTTGHGEPQSDILQVVKLNGFNIKTCNAFYSEASSATVRFPRGISRTQICAGGDERKDTCQGDSGGPLFLPNEQKRCIYYVAGVTSFGPSHCGQRAPAVYTNVLSYLDWIENIVWGTSRRPLT